MKGRVVHDKWTCFCDICQNVINAGSSKWAAILKKIMLFDSRKVPVNKSFTNGSHQAAFDLFLMALM